MKVHIVYKATGEKVCTYYNCIKISKDEGYVENYTPIHSCTLHFSRDEEKDITILSPCTVNLDKFDIIIERY